MAAGTGQRIVELVRHRPGITRREVADALDIAVTTVNPLVARMVTTGLMDESVEPPAPGGGIGRPRGKLHVIGTTHPVAVLIWSHGELTSALAGFDGRVLHRTRRRVSGHPSSDLLESAATELLGCAVPPGVGAARHVVLGMPAPYERGVGLPRYSSSPTVRSDESYAAWFASEPSAELSERLGIPVQVENDANLGALGESEFGAGRAAASLIYLRLSDRGIGSGITVERELLKGSHGFAGEIAHLRVDDDSAAICACGSRGCLELKLGQNLLRQLYPTYGDQLTYEDVLQLVENGAPGPVRMLTDTGRLIGRPLADISTFINPELIVVEAGSPAASELIRRGVQDQIEQSVPPFIQNNLSVVTSELADDAALLGAVELARRSALAGVV